jgi:diguanylate cyclase (GGDEF)-like protein
MEDDDLLEARVASVLSSNTGAAVTGWLGAVIVAMGFWRQQTAFGITLWITLLAVAHGTRILVASAYQRRIPKDWSARRWGAAAVAANGLAGLVCGAGCYWLAGEGEGHRLTLLCGFVMAIGVASFANIAYWPAHAALHVPTFILTSVGFARLGQRDDMLIGAGAVLLCGFILWLARSMGRSIVLSMRLALDNRRLAEELRSQATALQQSNRELTELSATDPLTALANRRRLEAFLFGEWQSALREQRPITLLIIDVDDFKAYNDRYGHSAGDDCLQLIAAVLRRCVRQGADLSARYGGEEFAVVLPGADLLAAAAIAERIRQNVSTLDTQVPGPLRKTTVSIGMASITPQPGSTPAPLLAAADRALYEAKNAGRNRVVSTDLPPAPA